jgi:hypothetical protein
MNANHSGFLRLRLCIGILRRLLRRRLEGGLELGAIGLAWWLYGSSLCPATSGGSSCLLRRCDLAWRNGSTRTTFDDRSVSYQSEVLANLRLGVGCDNSSCGIKNVGGGEIATGFGVKPLVVAFGSIGVLSKSAWIQTEMPYSSASSNACSGEIQTFPAVSSVLVVFKLLIYLRSASSSWISAYGKVALNLSSRVSHAAYGSRQGAIDKVVAHHALHRNYV